MKIAVVDHIGNHGGGSRVVRALLPVIKRVDPSVEITYFGSSASIAREELDSLFSESNIKVNYLRSCSVNFFNSAKFDFIRKSIRIIQEKFLKSIWCLPCYISGNIEKEISNTVTGYDIAFFPWPYLLKFPALDCPVVGIFHDFNFKYYFGSNFVFNQAQRMQLDKDMPDWMEGSIPVVSSLYISSELISFYPKASKKVRIVHLPPLYGECRVNSSRGEGILKELNISRPYILCPTHMCSHKNVGPLIGAHSILKQEFSDLMLIFTGSGTESIVGESCKYGVRLNKENYDVIGVGYVSNEQINALIQCASVVVNPSLYEAGNGPGLDAWGLGAPVAMSDIPSFREHLDVIGVRAKLFDPRSSVDIAVKIRDILNNSNKSLIDVQYSMKAIQSLTWESAASKYLEIFREAILEYKCKNV